MTLSTRQPRFWDTGHNPQQCLIVPLCCTTSESDGHNTTPQQYLNPFMYSPHFIQEQGKKTGTYTHKVMMRRSITNHYRKKSGRRGTGAQSRLTGHVPLGGNSIARVGRRDPRAIPTPNTRHRNPAAAPRVCGGARQDPI